MRVSINVGRHSNNMLMVDVNSVVFFLFFVYGLDYKIIFSTF